MVIFTARLYAQKFTALSLGKVIVNIMSPVMRNFYKLESRWKDGVVGSQHNNVSCFHILFLTGISGGSEC